VQRGSSIPVSAAATSTITLELVELGGDCEHPASLGRNRGDRDVLQRGLT
jgi:hypothetical protein